MRYNSWRRKVLALGSVPALALPSAIGVERYLEPESGAVAAWSAAVGFEILYVGVNILILRSPELRRYARNVSLAAVVTAVVLNSLSHYRAIVPLAYSGAPFSPLAALLALVASLPLAGLAYAVSVLLHRLSEDEAAASTGGYIDPPLQSDALAKPSMRMPERPALAHAVSDTGIERTSMKMQPDGVAEPSAASVQCCPTCGTAIPDHGVWMAARRWKRCDACRGP